VDGIHSAYSPRFFEREMFIEREVGHTEYCMADSADSSMMA
jgi:hypothetical protein